MGAAGRLGGHENRPGDRPPGRMTLNGGAD